MATTAAGIRKFTGFIAADGTTHDTMKKAVQHANDQKVKEALNAFNIKADEGQDVSVVRMDQIGEYLFNNRVAILAALNAKATIRKTRTPKAKGTVAVATASANDDQAQSAA